MTTPAPRRPLSSHPAFVPLVAAWFAALLGLAVAVLPLAILQDVFGALGLGATSPPTLTERLAACLGAALAGGAVGLALALALARRAGADPRPIYAEAEPPAEDDPGEQPVRRPLRVREELDEGFDDTPAPRPSVRPPPPMPAPTAAPEGAAEGFMILTPQPVHPPRPAPDLEALLDRFDHALDAFRADEGRPVAAAAPATAGLDPVQAFLARQAGGSAAAQHPATAQSPMGGLMPDHQAELRAALDKLARAHRKD